MNAQELSNRIENARPPYTDEDRWTGRCPTKSHENPEDDEFRWADNSTYVWVKCWKGCERAEILAALGLTEDDLLLGALTVEALAEAKGFTADYLRSLGVVQERAGVVKVTYRTADGAEAPRYQRRRSLAAKPKYKWDDKGKGTGGTMPYGLWRLAEMRAAEPDVVDDPYSYPYLFIVEGASDCWAAWLHGEPCLGLPGSSTARLLRAEHVEGFVAVYLVREPGTGGDNFVSGVSARLEEVGYSGLVFDAQMPEGIKDVGDVLLRYPERAAFRDQLARARASAAPVDVASREPVAAPPADGARYERRPGGNRDRLVDSFSKDMAYAPGLGWMDWDGTRWRNDTSELYVHRRAEAVVQQLRAEAEALQARAEADPGNEALSSVAKSAYRWYQACYARHPMNEMIDLAKSDARILRDVEDFDGLPMLFNARNGTVDVRTGLFRPHRQEDLLTYISPVVYDPAAESPRWEQFIDEVMLGDAEMVSYLRRLVGYCMTGDVSEDAFFIFYGLGSNGKTTFLEVLRRVMGREYAKTTPPSTFLKKNENSSGATPDIARLRAARLVTAVEVERAARLNTGMVKAASGGDRQIARRLYEDFMEFDAQYKVILATNNKPEIHDNSEGMWRRVHLVPWEAVFNERREGFTKKIQNVLMLELPGILNWCLRGAREWAESGLDRPAKVAAATQEYQEQQDPLADFVSERCALGREQRVPVDELYQDYVRWCIGKSERPEPKTKLGAMLSERGVRSTVAKVGKKATRVYEGLGLRPAGGGA